MQLVTSTLKLPCVTDSQLCSWIYGTTFAAASRGLWACSCLFVMWWKQKVWPRRGAAHPHKCTRNGKAHIWQATCSSKHHHLHILHNRQATRENLGEIVYTHAAPVLHLASAHMPRGRARAACRSGLRSSVPALDDRMSVVQPPWVWMANATPSSLSTPEPEFPPVVSTQ